MGLIDKLNELEINIHEDLITIMFLYSHPDNFENFRCAIESRDELPNLTFKKLKLLKKVNPRHSKD